MKTIGTITVEIILFVLEFLLTLLGVNIILSISKLYTLEFINQFSFIQLFGIIIILRMFSYKYEENKGKKEWDDILKSSFTQVITKTLIYLSIWGLAFLYFYILK